MKRLLYNLVYSVAAFAMILTSLPTLAQTSLTAEENSLMNCGVWVDVVLTSAYAGTGAMDITQHVDTLYNYLYTNPIETSNALKYLGKTSLQAALVTMGDPRADYREMERCIANLGKAEKLYNHSFIICAYHYAMWASRNGEDDKMLAACQYGTRALDKLHPNETTPFSQVFFLLQSSYYFDRKEWNLAAKYKKRELEDLKLQGKRETAEYLTLLREYAQLSYLSGNNAETLAANREYIEACPEVSGVIPDDIVDVILSSVNILEHEGQRDEAKKLLLPVLEMTVEQPGNRLGILNHLAQIAMEEKDYTQSAAYTREALATMESISGLDVATLNNWKSLFENPVLTKADMKRIFALLPTHTTSVEHLAILGSLKWMHGERDEAIAVLDKIDGIIKTRGFSEMSISELLSSSSLYLTAGRCDDNIEIAKHLVDRISSDKDFKDTDLYASSLSILADAYFLKGDLNQCIDCYDKILALGNITDGIKRQTKYGQAVALYALKDFYNSRTILKQVLSDTKDSVEIMETLDLLISILVSEIDVIRSDSFADSSMLPQLLDELNTYTEIQMGFVAEKFDKDHEYYIDALMNKCTERFLAGDKSGLRKFCDNLALALSRCTVTLDTRNNKSGLLCYVLAKQGETKRALNILSKLDLADDADIDDNYFNFLQASSDLQLKAYVLAKSGKLDEAQQLADRLAGMVRDHLLKRLPLLSSRERYNYWLALNSNIMNSVGYIRDRSSVHTENLYDMLLSTRSILLDTDIAFRKRIAESGEGAMNNLRSIQSIRDIALLHTLSQSEKDYLCKLSEGMEKLLMANISDDDLKGYSWKAIQEKLDHKSAAVEFVVYNDMEEVPHYAAVVIGKGSLHPELITIGSKEHVEKGLGLDWYGNASGIVWEPLSSALKGKTEVYFVPSGMLCNYPIEVTTAPEVQAVRLSSTRKLLDDNIAKPGNLVLFGGIDYGGGITETASTERRVRTSLTPLPGTLKELISIEELAKELNIPVKTFTGKEAMASALKGLSHSDVRVLHIGTHGQYTAPVTRTYLGGNANVEDLALHRSLLYFSDGYDQNISTTKGYSVITAYEISNLSFPNLDLVTLSACQSGLGDLSSEGVMGMQRAFKKAGANSILMTLWNVNDAATQLFVSEFYNNYLNGVGKQASLAKAREAVKANPKYSDPKFWAPFILVDALD